MGIRHKIVTGLTVAGLLGVSGTAHAVDEPRDQLSADLQHLVYQGFPGAVG